MEDWDDVVSARFSLVATLMAGMEAEKALWPECRNNVDEIAHHAINALILLNSSDADQQAFWLTVAAAALSVGNVVTTGGGAGVIALATAGVMLLRPTDGETNSTVPTCRLLKPSPAASADNPAGVRIVERGFSQMGAKASMGVLLRDDTGKVAYRRPPPAACRPGWRPKASRLCSAIEAAQSSEAAWTTPRATHAGQERRLANGWI
ncbi:hypothetical protein QLQ12_13550 [Actinoplanes sp. NEAU-A12]|uniref:Uncharacterized protein n=1 Tax=Actinoplanes sandaracinus TaxID=3045177 RepID=A0ABT6WIT0_9ACTN|nr:hypothetical protein [Actinoplanes sandaracinus]MDI6099622.1 hypothetical protein [Actinoplanes sandaracinus]